MPSRTPVRADFRFPDITRNSKTMKSIKLKLFGFNILEFGSLPDGRVPQKQTKFLSPRYEPSNIAADADVLRITEALRLAESGDTQELFRFYRDVLLSDDHIAGEFSTRKLAVLSQPLAILPEDKNNPDDVLLAKAMLRAKNDCENWLDGMKALMGSHAIWPVTVTERLYKPAGLNAGEGKFQQNVREDVRVHDQMTLAETCKKQIAWPFRDLNNLRGDVKFIWGGLSDADAKTFADLLYTMRQAGYQLAEESIPTANERTGLSWERAATPPPPKLESSVISP